MQEETKFYTCKNDRAFKEVFMRKENKDILIPLLECCLNIKIQDIEYLNLEDNVDNINVRRKSYDLRLSTDIGRIMIEVNANIYDYSRMRQFSYISNEYSHLILSGEDYDEDINVIQINFTYGMMKDFEEKYKYLYDDKDYRIYEVVDEEDKKFVNNFKILEFNMDYYMNLWYNKDKKLIDKYKYLIMMNLDLSNLLKLSKDNEVIDKYMEELERVNKDPKFIEYMSYEEDLRKKINTWKKRAKNEGISIGEKKGISIGKEEEKKELIIQFYKNNVDMETISKATGLSINEIQNIVNNI